MTTTKRPIEPSEIRKGDLIESSFSDRNETKYVVTYTARTDGAVHDGAPLNAFYYLIDRPKPRLLPEGINLGWARHHYHGPLLSFWQEKRYDNGNHRFDQTHPNGYHAAQAVDFDGFTPATAVPTEALDRFMRARHTPGATLGDINEASRKFLTAVDEANR